MTPDRPLTSGSRRRLSALSPRREMVAVLLLGAVGAGLVFLAMRQGWAQVRTAVPAPLPASVVTDSGQSLVPYADALAIAALASLAAVLATRRAARRVAGGLLAVLGVGIAAAVSFGVTTVAAVAAATGNIGPGAGAGAGTTAGSATEGGSQSGSIVPAVAGFHSHAVLTAASWQATAIAGALAIVIAGVLVIWRAERLPVMSSRYESPTGPGAVRPGRQPPPSAAPASTDSARGDRVGVGGASAGGVSVGRAGAGGPGTRQAGSVPDGAIPGGSALNGASPEGADRGVARPDETEPERADAASMWESLSRGEDPTSAGRTE